jgi:SagB-type dehydrogenase family enzyme
MQSRIGDDFQRGTKYQRGDVGAPLDWAAKPEVYKTYPSKRQIQLPHQFQNQTLPLIEVLRIRNSIRSYSPKALHTADLAFLLWASTGIQRKHYNQEFRTAPSAGALYPIETYLVVNNVEGLEKGLYHYNIQAHTLEELKIGALGKDLSHGALEQEMCQEAQVVFIWTAIFERAKWKYKQRAYRYVYLDAGHIAQNLALSATSIGLGSCQIGAIFDDEINTILDVDGIEESTIYLSTVGYPKHV